MGRNAKPWYRESVDAWYATIGGRQRRLAKGAKNQAEAMTEFYRLKTEEERVTQERDELSLYLLCDMFLSHVKRNCEPDTLGTYVLLLKGGKRSGLGFVDFVGPKTPSTLVKPFDVTNWLDSKAWGGSMRGTATRIVKRMFNWAVSSGYLASNPVANLKAPVSRVREDVLTAEQADAIYAQEKSESFRHFLTALRETGCRPKEIWTLTADRVDLEAGTWQVIDKIRGKTGQTHRTVYLTKGVAELSRKLATRHPEGPIFRNRDGNPWSRKTLSRRFLRLQIRLKYGRECVAYSYRHLYVTDALERGISPTTVAELMGHRDLKMIMQVYSKLRHRTDHLRDAAELARRTPEASRPAERSDVGPREPKSS